MTRLTLELTGDTGLTITRRFRAPPAMLYRAHTDPAIMPRWMTGPDGWTMPHCVSDPRPGGAIRCDWVNAEGQRFFLTGSYLELEPGRRILHVERMHLPDPTPENRIETLFEADGTGTRLTVRMSLPDAATRAAMLATGMTEGMEASYARLDGLDPA